MALADLLLMIVWLLLVLGLNSARGQEPPQLGDRAVQARIILEKYCYRCHGQPGQRTFGDMNYILDRNALVDARKVVPGQPEASGVIQRLEDGNDPMPPVGVEPRPSRNEIEMLKSWIRVGAPGWGAPPVGGPARIVEFVTDADVLGTVERDFLNQPAGVQPYLAYFSLLHWRNYAMPPLALDTLRAALTKELNFLSTRPKILFPSAIDAERLIFRVDIRQLGWRLETWRALQATNPFLESYRGRERAQGSYTSYGNVSDHVARADWFLAAASRGPFYFQFLNAPNTDVALETQIGVAALANAAAGRVVRSGFTQSGTEANNRVIERHQARYFDGPGAYWKSFNFDANLLRGNIFAYPLGPGNGPLAFKQNDSDIIYRLPNGLHGYMTVNDDGQRLDEQNQETGLKCMTCHLGGLLFREDQVREASLAQRELFGDPQAIQKILRMYVTPEVFRAAIDRDNQDSYDIATRAMQLAEAQLPYGRQTPVVNGELVNIVVKWFDAELDLATAAAELGVAPQDLFDRLAALPSRSLGSLLVPRHGTVKRDAFLASYGFLQKNAVPAGPLVGIRLENADELLARKAALFRAARAGQVARVKALLDLGMDVNERNVAGATLLIEAAREGQAQLARFLYRERHADPEIRDLNGYTALEWAQKKNFQEIISILQSP
jgi:hypothetical protein